MLLFIYSTSMELKVFTSMVDLRKFLLYKLWISNFQIYLYKKFNWNSKVMTVTFQITFRKIENIICRWSANRKTRDFPETFQVAKNIKFPKISQKMLIFISSKSIKLTTFTSMVILIMFFVDYEYNVIFIFFWFIYTKVQPKF